MKRQLTTPLLAVLLLCSTAVFSQFIQAKNSAALSLRGAYAMQKQTIDSGNGAEAMNTTQLKIYTDKYMMYAHRRSATDSMAEIGVGTYKVENGKIFENVFFSANGPQNNAFELAISKLGDGYRQVIDFPSDNSGKHFILTEDYKNASNKMVSPLDGAWKLVALMYADKNGNEMKVDLDEQTGQYKFYESGHFMWGNRWKDKAGKMYTGYGYGTFRMTGPDAAAEYNESSTYTTALVGKTMNLNLKFTGNDRYQQTIVSADGTKQIETYERLK